MQDRGGRFSARLEENERASGTKIRARSVMSVSDILKSDFRYVGGQKQ